MNKKTFSLFVRRRSVRAIVLLAIAATGTLASCDDEATDGNSLPDGKHPMTFTAAVEGVAKPRAVTTIQGKDAWTVNDQIGI